MIQFMIVPYLQNFFDRLARFPWRNTARTLRLRFRDDRLGQTAGSLTFTTTIALVPLVTVALAVLTAFPMFADFQTVLQKKSFLLFCFGGKLHPYVKQFKFCLGGYTFCDLRVC